MVKERTGQFSSTSSDPWPVTFTTKHLLDFESSNLLGFLQFCFQNSASYKGKIYEAYLTWKLL